MFKTDHQAINRNLDACVAALDQAPTGLLAILLRLAKRLLERRVPDYYPTDLKLSLREIGIRAEMTGFCLECGTYHTKATKAVEDYGLFWTGGDC